MKGDEEGLCHGQRWAGAWTEGPSGPCQRICIFSVFYGETQTLGG